MTTTTKLRHLPNRQAQAQVFLRREITPDGYVRGVRCAVGHSGNTRLAAQPGSWWAQCSGCGVFVAPMDCREASADTDHGQGGVRRVDAI